MITTDDEKLHIFEYDEAGSDHFWMINNTSNVGCNVYGNSALFEKLFNEENKKNSKITNKSGTKFLKFGHNNRLKYENVLYKFKYNKTNNNK